MSKSQFLTNTLAESAARILVAIVVGLVTGGCVKYFFPNNQTLQVMVVALSVFPVVFLLNFSRGGGRRSGGEQEHQCRWARVTDRLVGMGYSRGQAKDLVDSAQAMSQSLKSGDEPQAVGEGNVAKAEGVPASLVDATIAVSSTPAIAPDSLREPIPAPTQIKEQPAANSNQSKVFYKALPLADGSVQVVVTAVGLSGRQFKGPDGLKDKIATIKIPGVTFKPGNNAAKQERTLTAKVRPGPLQVRILGAIFLQLEELDVLPSEEE